MALVKPAGHAFQFCLSHKARGVTLGHSRPWSNRNGISLDRTRWAEMIRDDDTSQLVDKSGNNISRLGNGNRPRGFLRTNEYKPNSCTRVIHAAPSCFFSHV